MKLSLALVGLEDWFGGDHAAVTGLVVLADRKGIDQVTVVDHVVMGDAVGNYPFGKFAQRPDSPWLEPLVQLGVYAGATKRIRLGAGIVIAPLRPAALLAKQFATLDVLSGGRAEIGVGVGWQKEEYDACGVPWEGRFGRLHEQMQACRVLWSQSPASFHGEHVRFDGVHSFPRPLQPGGVPLHYGVAATERNIARMAELADGWLPIDTEPAKLAAPIARIKAAVAAAGRDSSRFEVRASPLRDKPVDGKADIAATLRRIPDYAAAGVTTLRINVDDFCAGPAQFESFLDRALDAAKG